MPERLEDIVTVIRKLGSGGYGNVYLAKIRDLPGVDRDTIVAVKLIRYRNSEQIKEYEREVNIIKRLSSYRQKCHKTIICYYESMMVEHEGKDMLAIFMEFFTGMELEQYIELAREHRFKYDVLAGLSVNEVHHIFFDLLAGLAYMHDKGVIHRDIKPENILYNPDTNQVKYIDFGFSCDSNAHDSTERCYMVSLGTYEFNSPELANLKFSHPRSGRDADDIELLKETDVWALGIVFYEFLFGYTPTYSLYMATRGNAREYHKRLSQFSVDPSKIPKYDPRLDRYVRVTLEMLNSDYTLRPTAQEALSLLKRR